MPRPLADYSVADWWRLRPLTQALKTLRYRAVTALYMGRRARAGSAAAIARQIAGRKVLVAIAFGDSVAVDWQTRLVARNVPHALHVIADNSPDDASAWHIEAIAARAQVPYIRLPDNPWRASRGHGLALNWTWRNVIRPGRPEAFGFLDDDLFPTAPDDPFAPLAAQDFFGLIRVAGERWFLWTGFCVFRFDRVGDKPLDFGQDWFIGLDTGGANWRVLYRDVDRAKLRQPDTRFVPCRPGIALEDAPLQWCGSWLHEIGAMGRPELQADKRRVVAQMLAPHLSST